MSLIKAKCPYCQTLTEIDSNKQLVTCNSCGATYEVQKDKPKIEKPIETKKPKKKKPFKKLFALLLIIPLFISTFFIKVYPQHSDFYFDIDKKTYTFTLIPYSNIENFKITIIFYDKHNDELERVVYKFTPAEKNKQYTQNIIFNSIEDTNKISTHSLYIDGKMTLFEKIF